MMWETLLTLAMVGFVSADPFPSDLERCHFGDTECLRVLINEYVRTLKDGHAGLDLPPIDPLHVDELDIIQNTAGPVKLSLRFKDIDVSGLSDLNVTKVVGFERDPTTSKYEMYVHVPQLRMVGQLKSGGDILFLHFNGNGTANLTLGDLDLSMKCKNPKFATKDGKQYVNLYESDICLLKFDVKRVWMDFQDLFQGKKLINKATNRILNENWQILLNELRPTLSEAMNSVVKNVIARVFWKIPYEELLI